MNPAVFREYDIRGVADRDLDDDFTRALGRALAGRVAERAPAGRRLRIAVGRDCRITSPRLRDALVDGLTGAGADVIDVGVVATPVLYYAPFAWELDGAVVITGSHNPAPDNGFKILYGRSTIHGAEIQELRRRVEAGPAPGPGGGTVEERDLLTPYLEHARASLRLGPRRPRVVLDAGNGAGGPAGVALYRSLGFDVVALHCEMDGRFPNHHPDPTVEKNLADLRAAVAAEGADLGIAFDGDADRVGAIDGRGRVLWGDQLMILFGLAILRERPGATFIGEVKCSQALFDVLGAAGGVPIMWKVGHSLIKAKIKEVGAALGGEMSGHIFFADRYPGFDDAIYAGARLLELLSHDERDLAGLYDTLPVMVNTPELRVECPDPIKFAVVDRVTARLRARADVLDVVDIDGVRARFEGGWGLIRASNTQPALVMRCEAASAARLDEIRATIEAELAAARAEP